MYKTQSLRPTNVSVKLHNGTHVTVPVFDIKSMIINLLNDQTLMNKQNLAEGYNIFTGDIDNYHPFNTTFGEVHTGDAWLPARNRFCRSTEKGVYMDPCLSHQSYSLCHCSIGMHETITCSGGPLVTFQISLMERVLQIRLQPETKFKTSMYVCQLCLDLFERYPRRMDLIRRCLVKMYMCQWGFIILLVTQKATTNGWVSIQATKKVSNAHIETANALIIS